MRVEVSVVLIKPRLTAFAGICLGFLSKYRLRVDDRRIAGFRLGYVPWCLDEIFLSARQLLRVRIAYHGSAPEERLAADFRAVLLSG